MKEEFINELIKISLTVIGGLYIFFAGRKEYIRTQKLKRAEFLDKLISDFLAPETEIARKMLDDYVYVKKENRNKSPQDQKNLAIPLATYLRNHLNEEPIGMQDEIEVRNSFDKLLDFFTKLSYYLNNKLISPRELTYFKYYIVKIKDKQEVIKYISAYYYPEDFVLIFSAIDKLDSVSVGTRARG
jgi:hypothetical protein